MPKSLSPFLMFQDNNAEEAMNFYVSLFDDGQMEVTARFGAAGPGKDGSVMRGHFTIAGQKIMVFDSPVKHAFGFTPSVSLFIECESEAEQNRLFSALSEKGAVLMGLADYGFSRRFGWCNDRYGVSWQINLP